MNFFKLKNPSSPPPQPPQATLQLPPLPPPITALQQAFTSLQTQFTSFLHNHFPPPAPATTTTSPLWAKKHNPYDFTSGKSKGLSIEERLAVIPVYGFFKSTEKLVVIEGAHSGTHLGMFCFNEADAEACLQKIKTLQPSSFTHGCQVLPVSLSTVFTLKIKAEEAEGVSIRLIPEASQVKNAISERKKVCIIAKDFPGIPVFQEDMEKALEIVSQEQRRTFKPSLRRGDTQVASFEDIIKGMKDDSSTTWDDVVFVPPGFGVSFIPTGQLAS